jgi:hypothetical protein
MNKEELIKNLKHTIQEHKVSSYWIEAFKDIGYSENMDNWVNVYYIEEWLNYALKDKREIEG